jgi:hypothetical protein
MYETKTAKIGTKASAVRKLPVVPVIVLEDPTKVRDNVETWIARNPNVLAGA